MDERVVTKGECDDIVQEIIDLLKERELSIWQAKTVLDETKTALEFVKIN